MEYSVEIGLSASCTGNMHVAPWPCDSVASVSRHTEVFGEWKDGGPRLVVNDAAP